MKYLFVGGKKIYVSEEVYKAFRKSKRREKYLEEQAQAHGEVSFDCLFREPLTGNTVEEMFDKSEQSKILWSALAELSEDEFDFVNLHFFENFTLDEIAEMANTNYISCWRKRRRILEKLRLIIGDNLQP